jgi:F-type H+-transporting ATPase subunit epsilon
MKLAIRTPIELVVEADDVSRLAAEADDGAFAVEPRHMDFVTILAPGILTFATEHDEHTVAVDRGVLVKCGSQLMVSVRDAVKSDSLEDLESALREHLLARSDRERHATSALARLESSVVQGLLNLGWSGND